MRGLLVKILKIEYGSVKTWIYLNWLKDFQLYGKGDVKAFSLEGLI